MTSTDRNLLLTATHRLAWVSSLLYIVLHVLDILLTYTISPELEREMNIMISRHGYGWDYIFISATIASFLMLIAQLWVWKNLAERLTSHRYDYKAFYEHILFSEKSPSTSHAKHDTKGILLAITLIICYSILASKFFVVLWNAALLTLGVHVESFGLFLLVLNLLAGLFGVYMFFGYLYRLHIKYSGSVNLA